MALLVRLASYATVLAFTGVANAQTPAPTTGVATPPATAAKPPAAPSTRAPTSTPAAPAAPVVSESKFLGALYSEIAKQSPRRRRPAALWMSVRHSNSINRSLKKLRLHCRQRHRRRRLPSRQKQRPPRRRGPSS